MTAAEYNNCVNQHADGLYRFILKNVRNAESAKDIVQDSFEKLWTKVADVNVETAKSYLFTIGYNTMIDSIRKQKITSDIDDASTQQAATSNDYTDIKHVLNVALLKLPEIQRVVITLRDYEGYNYHEIGEITGLTESQVKVYIYRARVFLKSFIVNVDRVI